MRKLSEIRQAETSLGEGGRVRAPRDVYDTIKSDILSLALRPGQDLDEVSLGRRYGVSRTPVREALIRLASERLVAFGQNRRASVTQLILADFPRFIEALDLTRRAVGRLAAARRHDSDIVKIRDAQSAFAAATRGVKAGSDAFARRVVPLETEFHLAIAEAGHNSYLTGSYDQLMTIGHRMLHLPFAYDPGGGEPIRTFVARVIERQGCLVTAIAESDGAAAEEAARALTADLVLRLRSYLEENLASTVGVGVPSSDRVTRRAARTQAKS
ncbi:MAG: GntR family transcriptional regulator [Hyphomicrobiaceae bacterium]